MRDSFDFSTRGKYRGLSRKQSMARLALLSEAIGRPGGITKEKALEIVTNIAEDDAADILRLFIDKNIVGQNADGGLEHLYPVSCVETPHKVILEDGRSFYAMCAIDSLGAASTFGMRAKISSYCKDTGEPVEAVVNTDGIDHINPSGLYVSYYDIWAGKEDQFNY